MKKNKHEPPGVGVTRCASCWWNFEKVKIRTKTVKGKLYCVGCIPGQKKMKYIRLQMLELENLRLTKKEKTDGKENN